MIRHFFLLLILLLNGCSKDSEKDSPLLGGWTLYSIQIGDKKIESRGLERYHFQSDGTLTYSSISSDIDLSYETSYGLLNVSGKKLLIIKNPLNSISSNGDTLSNYEVNEIQEVDFENLVLRFVSKIPCNDSLNAFRCESYRTHYYKRLEWNYERVNDSIPIN